MPKAEPDGGARHWFESAADHMGSAYLRYSFTKGTMQEVDFLVDALEVTPGSRILDVGCGPGRHALELSARGYEVVGLDVSDRFVQIARREVTARGLTATFICGDARAMSYNNEFDAVISLCQGAFGLQGTTDSTGWSESDGDAAVLDGIARSLRPHRRAAVSAFSSYFQVRYLEDSDTFDAATGVKGELTELRDEQGQVIDHELWTTCFTPRELRLLAQRVGLEVEAIWSVEPGRYARRDPTTDTPEFLLVASKQ